MATITQSYETDKNLTTFTVVGETTIEELWNETSDFLEGNPSKFTIWDFTCGTVKNITSQEASKLALNGGNLRSKIAGGKAAILAPKDIDYGVARIFQAFAELKNFPLEIQPFRDMVSALNWLGSNTKI